MIITRAMITNTAAILNHFTQSDCDTLSDELEPVTRQRLGIDEDGSGIDWHDTDSGEAEIEELEDDLAEARVELKKAEEEIADLKSALVAAINKGDRRK